MTPQRQPAGHRMAGPRLAGPGRLGRLGKLAAVTMLASVATLIAGCSGGVSGPGSAPVANLTGAAGQAGGTVAKPLTQEQSDLDMVHFTRCMRAHGVAMSDPFHRPGHAGLSIDMPTQDAQTRAAYAACTHFIAAIIGAKQAGAAALPARLAALTRYAECMRSHDINMLDPTADGQLNLGNVAGISSDFGRYSPQFRAADGACRHLLPAGTGDDGTGP
jgi:hypothetical protein